MNRICCSIIGLEAGHTELVAEIMEAQWTVDLPLSESSDQWQECCLTNTGQLLLQIWTQSERVSVFSTPCNIYSKFEMFSLKRSLEEGKIK